MTDRPDWDQTFFDVCEVFARRSPDPRTKLGSVIVRPDHTVVSTGYNSLPKGVTHLPELLERPLKSLWMVHAEENAILFAGEPLDGYTLYCPIMPCFPCARKIVQKRIGEVVVKKERVAAYWSPEYSQQFAEVERLFSLTGVVLRMV